MTETGGAVLVVPPHIQLDPYAEEVAATLREVGTAVPVVAGKVDEHPPPARQPVGRLLRSIGKDALARSGPKSEALVLEERITGFAVRRICGVIIAGILLAALVAVITGYIEDDTYAQWSAEADGVPEARVGIVASEVQQQPQAANRRSLRKPGTDVLIVARRIVEDSQPGEAGTAGTL